MTWVKEGAGVSVSSSRVSGEGIKPPKQWRGIGRPSRARARSDTAASASSAVVQVNRRLLKNTSPKPGGFFSKVCDGLIHGRTCRNTCCAKRLAPAAVGPAMSRLRLADVQIDAGSVSPPNRTRTVPVPRRRPTRVPRPSHRNPATSALRPTGRRCQLHPDGVMAQPQAQRVFLVADETSALPRLERAPAQCGVRGGEWPGAFFCSRHRRRTDRWHPSVPPATTSFAGVTQAGRATHRQSGRPGGGTCQARSSPERFGPNCDLHPSSHPAANATCLQPEFRNEIQVQRFIGTTSSISRASRAISLFNAVAMRCFVTYTLARLTPSDLATSAAGHS